MNFKNFGEDAAWPLTTVTHEDYMRMPGPKSDWLQVEGFRLENLAFDFMHNVFLGTARDLCGSSIRVLLRFGWYDHVEGDIDCKLAAIQREMVRDCRDLGCLDWTSTFWYVATRIGLGVEGSCGAENNNLHFTSK